MKEGRSSARGKEGGTEREDGRRRGRGRGGRRGRGRGSGMRRRVMCNERRGAGRLPLVHGLTLIERRGGLTSMRGGEEMEDPRWWYRDTERPAP